MKDSSSPSPERPGVGVSTAIWRDGAVLLVRRGRPPLAGKWSLPGGRVEWGERLAEAAAREVREETAIEAEIVERIDVAEILGPGPPGRGGYHYVLVVFAGRFRSGEVQAGDDAAEARWVPAAALAGLDLTADTARVLAAGPR